MEVPNLKSIRRYFLVFHLKTFTNLDRLLQTLSESVPSSIPTPGVEQWNNRTIVNRWKKNKVNYEKLSIAKSANAFWRRS